MVQPDVAIMDIAQKGLHFLDRLDKGSSLPGSMGREISNVYRNRLAAIRMAW